MKMYSATNPSLIATPYEDPARIITVRESTGGRVNHRWQEAFSVVQACTPFHSIRGYSMKIKAMRPMLLAIPLLLLAGIASAADRGDRVERRLDNRGDRIDNRLDHRGDRIDERLDRRSERAEDNGHERRASHLDNRGDRIENRLDHRGDRAGNRLDRRGEHFDRRWDRRH